MSAPRPADLPALAADELAYATTDDGYRIALHRYRARGPRRRHVVVACHGLACNHVAFDPSVDTSLARHLAQRGYETIVLDLRGHGQSDRASLRGPRRYTWTFDDYLLSDVPAALREAARITQSHDVHWIGHSMGGLLLYAHLARGGAGIRSGIAVGSSLDYSAGESGFHGLLRFRALLSAVPAVPIGLVARAAARFVGHVPTPFERFNVWSSNVDPAVFRAVCERGFHAVPPALMTQLATAMRPGGLRSADGRVAYLEGLPRATTPVLSLAGDRDAQCPPEAARSTLEALGSARREHKTFGTAHGHADHYGHFDLLVGRRAKTEVWPVVDAWLDEHDG
jgi:alpha-beta hydrolase superfamily lysophospholipase